VIYLFYYQVMERNNFENYDSADHRFSTAGKTAWYTSLEQGNFFFNAGCFI